MSSRGYDEHIAHHPHDGLVRRMLGRPETAAVELRAALPASITDRLDWDTLTIAPGSFVDPKLRAHHSDILYSIALRGEERRVFVYVLMEHQHMPERMMAWRLLRYICRIWERHERDSRSPLESLPLVVPLVLCQGSRGWTQPRRLSELLDMPVDIAQAITAPVELVFDVDDLQRSVLRDRVDTNLQQLARGPALAEAVRTLLWLADRPKSADRRRIGALAPLLEVVRRRWGIDDLQALLTYVITVLGNDAEIPAMIIEASSEETRGMYATIQNKFIEQGRAEGLAQALTQLLARRQISVSPRFRERLESCEDPELVQRWFDRALTARTIEEIFEG